MKLRFVDRVDLRDGLDFEDDLAGHDQVHAVRIVDELPSVRNRQRNLAFEGNPSSLKLDSQARLVGRFEEPRPQLSVDLNGRGTDLVGEFGVDPCRPEGSGVMDQRGSHSMPTVQTLEWPVIG